MPRGLRGAGRDDRQIHHGLAMDSAEEWLNLEPLDERPMLVETLTGWFGVGPYLDAFTLILTGGGRDLVIATTDEFALRIATRDAARRRAETVAANMNLRLVEVRSAWERN
jgi:hypothetical protein